MEVFNIKQVKAIIFDMDGVIVDTEPLSQQHEREFLAELGVEPRRLDVNLQGLNARAYFMTLKAAYDLEQSVDELINLWRPSYMAYLSALDIPVIAGVAELIRHLAASDYQLAIGSSANPKRIELILNKTSLRKYFSVIVHGDDITKSKPDPECFRLAAERLGVAPADCLVIEDSTNGVVAATAAGMLCVGYAGSDHNTDNLSVADLIVKDFAELKQIFR